jgi:predicted ABC-type transport system involved in lysophospholipase L1 biosynthesis ATPase subunit
MSLLELDGVSRRHGRGANEHAVLREVSLQLDSGELVAVWGPRRSGRSTLLRVAAGIERADAGTVRFAGHALTGRGGPALGGGIGWCRRSFAGGEDRDVLDELTAPLLARGVLASAARTRVWAAMERAGVEDCAARSLAELDSAETVRVAVARSLAMGPKLLVVDEPCRGVDLLERDGLLALLRSLADGPLAVLMTVGEATALAGADRALSLSDGSLRGSLDPELADVVPLRRVSG